MNPLLIARQGFGGGALAVALMGFVVSTPAVVQLPVPQPPTQYYGGGSIKRFKVAHDRFDIPLLLTEHDNEEEVMMTILMEISENEL